ncbi:MAG: DUF4173 domain-containing protein [Dehalococcoidia bacterium]
MTTDGNAASSGGAPALGAAPAPVFGTVDAFVRGVLAPARILTERQAWIVAATALGLGLWTDVLFAGTWVGLNLPVWVASMVAAAIVLGRRFARPIEGQRVAILAVSVLLYSVFAWRASIVLMALGWIGGTSLLFMGVAMPAEARVDRLGVTSYVLALVGGCVALASSGLLLAERLASSALPAVRQGTHTASVVRGVVLAGALLFVFGTLFVAADAVFEAQVSQLFAFDLSAYAPHIARILFGGWVGLAVLWASVGIRRPHDLEVEPPSNYRLRRLEVGIALGALALLFALFVVVQVRYLFGGADLVRSSVALTYAEYARRGFFELVAASLLLLPVLAGINWARERNVPALRLFLALGGTLGVLLLVIVASAWERLAIYREAYGLTELRFYAVATLPWLVATLVTFFVLVVRGRTRAFISLASALVVAELLAFYLLSPDDFIVRTNGSRGVEGRPFDGLYAASLSADAVPALLERLAEVPAAERCSVVQSLRAFANPDDDFRSWNASRATAARLVRARAADLTCAP